MARKRNIADNEVENLVAQLRKLGKHQYAQVVAEASKERGAKAREAVAAVVNDDIQANLTEAGWEVDCPKCGGRDLVKKGRKNGLQRYQCKACGRKFTTTSGTLLEKSGYMWDVWVKVVHDLVNCVGMDRTLKSLRDDYGCIGIHRETVFNMRMKVLYAVWSIPSPVLRGTVQMDDTFFREDQKGCRGELKNPLPKSANVERKPRYGAHPSLLGTLGPEFASATCAVDGTGHCVVRSLSMGAPTDGQVKGFIREHMRDVAFLCTDDDKAYRRAIRGLSLPHYICPSGRLAKLDELGHVQLSKDPEKAAVEEKANRQIAERLWKNGELDFIEGVEARTWNQRCRLVETYGLTIGRVNSLHGRLDDFVTHSRRGVSTNYLPLYLAMFEYLENRRADGKGRSSLADAAEILADAVATRKVFSGETAAEWVRGEHAPGAASKVFVAKLMDDTSTVRIATGNDDFKFNKSDGLRYVSPRDQLLALPMPTVKKMALELGLTLKEYKSKSRLVEAVLEALKRNGGLDEAIARYAYEDAAGRMDDEDREVAASARYSGRKGAGNRTVLSQTMPRMMFCGADEAEGKPVFAVVKTTGTKYDEDEVIGVCLVDGDGTVLVERKFRPRGKANWYQTRNNPSFIRPADVFGDDEVKGIGDGRAEIERVLRQAGCVVGWNIHFQLDMLHACHVDVPVERKYVDLCSAMYRDARKPNKNRRNAFDKHAQEKLEHAVGDQLGEAYSSGSMLDDVVYLKRLWDEFRGGE